MGASSVVTVLAERTSAAAPAPPPEPVRRVRWAYVVAPLVTALNGVLFLIVRPDVNDLWAARARAKAAADGVGLTYWFSWFGGGSTPGNYSVLTPYLSAVLTAEVVGVLAAVGITVGCQILLKGTAHPRAAVALAVVAAGINLWSGRIPFLLSSAFAIAALIAVKTQRRWWAGAFVVLSVASSPVPGAFLAIGLVATFVMVTTHRRTAAVTLGVIAACLGIVAVAFGTPGPEPFSLWLCGETILWLLVFLVARPPDYLRLTVYLSVVAAAVLVAIPNGMGSNFARLAWFCLPVAVVATSRLRWWVAVLVVAPVMLAGANGTVSDLRNARLPMSQTDFYRPLAAQLDTIPQLDNYRVEVVTHGAHAAYDALLNHAMLARGWETQEDKKLNGTLLDPTIDAVTYKVWLDNNAVGYIAFPRASLDDYPEYRLVAGGTLPYLTQVWSNDKWVLYKVRDASPIVGAPATLMQHSQAQLTIDAPCACTFTVRVRYSKYLHATAQSSLFDATVDDDGSGWTRITTTGPGVYYLRGTLTAIFR